MTREIKLRTIRHDPDGRYTMIGGVYPGSGCDLPTSVCVQQAYLIAVRHRPQSGDVVTLVDQFGVQMGEAPPCCLRSTDSMWPAHEPLHRVMVPLAAEELK